MPVRAVPLVVELPTLILFQDNQTLYYGALPLFSLANYRESDFCRRKDRRSHYGSFREEYHDAVAGAVSAVLLVMVILIVGAMYRW